MTQPILEEPRTGVLGRTDVRAPQPVTPGCGGDIARAPIRKTAPHRLGGAFELIREIVTTFDEHGMRGGFARNRESFFLSDRF